MPDQYNKAHFLVQGIGALKAAVHTQSIEQMHTIDAAKLKLRPPTISDEFANFVADHTDLERFTAMRNVVL